MTYLEAVNAWLDGALNPSDRFYRESCLQQAWCQGFSLKMANKAVPGKPLWTGDEISMHVLQLAKDSYHAEREDVPRDRSDAFRSSLEFLKDGLLRDRSK